MIGPSRVRQQGADHLGWDLDHLSKRTDLPLEHRDLAADPDEGLVVREDVLTLLGLGEISQRRQLVAEVPHAPLRRVAVELGGEPVEVEVLRVILGPRVQGLAQLGHRRRGHGGLPCDVMSAFQNILAGLDEHNFCQVFGISRLCGLCAQAYAVTRLRYKYSLSPHFLLVREPARVAAVALTLLEGVARRGRTLGRLGVGIVAEAARVAAGALTLLESVARRGVLLGSPRVGVVAEAARVAAVALAALERVAHGGAARGGSVVPAAAAAATLLVGEPTRVSAGALSALEGVAHGLGRGALAEAGLLGVLALGAAGGLVFPSLGLVKLLFAAAEDELGVAVAAVQGDVLVLLGEGVRVSRGLLVNLELLNQGKRREGDGEVSDDER